MTRVAAIDCGTNSIRLLIADRQEPATGAAGGGEPARLTDVLRTMEVVRLGQGVDRTGELDPVALERTLAAAARYGALCREHGVAALRFVATSATRDARNRQVFADGVREALGVEAEVVTGSEEAGLSFAGAVSALGAAGTGPRLVVDIGGGSTELVLGGERPTHAISLDMGCVRMSERHLDSDPPTPAELEAAAAQVRGALNEAAAVVPLGEVRTLVGVAGSVTTVTAHALALAAYAPERINGAVLPTEAVLAACQELMAMSRAQRSALGFMHPGRVDVIGAGALIWSEVITRVAAEVAAAGSALRQVVTSEHDILDGIALSVGVE